MVGPPVCERGHIESGQCPGADRGLPNAALGSHLYAELVGRAQGALQLVAEDARPASWVSAIEGALDQLKSSGKLAAAYFPGPFDDFSDTLLYLLVFRRSKRSKTSSKMHRTLVMSQSLRFLAIRSSRATRCWQAFCDCCQAPLIDPWAGLYRSCISFASALTLRRRHATSRSQIFWSTAACFACKGKSELRARPIYSW
jgi:hypothetical protein